MLKEANAISITSNEISYALRQYTQIPTDECQKMLIIINHYKII